MNKKIVMMLLVLGVCIPACATDKTARPTHRPMHSHKGFEYSCRCEGEGVGEVLPLYRQEDPLRKELRKKQIPQKVKQLLAQYKQLDGKNQEAKKAEIAAEVATVREAQLRVMQQRIDGVISSLKYQQKEFPKMEKDLQERLTRTQAEQEPAAKQAWVDEKTEALIASNGDVKVLFGPSCNCPSKIARKQEKRFKATEETMAKLVAAYKKSSGKKQADKKAQITEKVKDIREAQLEYMQYLYEAGVKELKEGNATLQNSLKRAKEMQQLIKEKQEAKKAWVEEKTEALIKAEGDLGVLFDRPARDMRQGKGTRPFFKGPKNGKFQKHPKDHKVPGPKHIDD